MSIGSVGVRPGWSTLQLPDGTVIALQDWRDRDHWGTCDITRFNTGQPIDVFSVGRSQIVPGSYPGRCATLADVSIPRNGGSGLPQGHQGVVFNWRAAVIGPADVIACDAAQAWFATTAVSFFYNGKPQAVLPLSELLRVVPAAMPPTDDDPVGVTPARTPAGVGGTPIGRQPAPVTEASTKPTLGRTFVLPIHLREHFSFEMRVEPQDEVALNALRITLGHVGAQLSVRVFISGLFKESVV